MAQTDKTAALKQIRDEVWHLINSPLYSYRKENNYYPVLGEGSHTAEIMFIGEAPGKTEAETGRPFCGAAGKLLDQLLLSINLDRQKVYITNIVKDRPPDNRDPSLMEIELYAPFLMRQIEIIQPQVIATLGRFSMKYLLEKFNSSSQHESISRLHGTLQEIMTSYGPIRLLPLFHPAVALYNVNQKEILFQDFKKLVEFVA